MRDEFLVTNFIINASLEGLTKENIFQMSAERRSHGIEAEGVFQEEKSLEESSISQESDSKKLAISFLTRVYLSLLTILTKGS